MVSRLAIWFSVLIAICACTLANASFGLAQEQAPPSELVVQTVVDQLDRPTGIAIQPQTGIVFVAEQGAQRIVRVLDGRADPAVLGFRKESKSDGEREELVRHLAFIDQTTLAVIVKTLPNEESDVLVFKTISAESGKKLSANISSRYRIGRSISKDLLSELSNFALGGFSIFVTGTTAESVYWLARGTFGDSGINKPIPVAPITDAGSNREITAIACSPHGFLTVAFVDGDVNQAGSVLAFFDDLGGKLGESRLDLAEVWGLAYHPLNGRLFVLGRQKGGVQTAGLFQIVTATDGNAVVSHRVLDLQRPFALTFNSQGELFVTLQGDEISAEQATATGTLIKISGLDASRPSWLVH